VKPPSRQAVPTQGLHPGDLFAVFQHAREGSAGDRDVQPPQRMVGSPRRPAISPSSSASADRARFTVAHPWSPITGADDPSGATADSRVLAAVRAAARVIVA